MSPAFLVAALAGALGTGLLATLACRDRNCFFTNVLAATAGAFVLTLAATRIGVGYSDFGTDLGTGLIFATVGGLVAVLFAAMARDLAETEPRRQARAPAAPDQIKATLPQPSRAGQRQPDEQQLACAEFQSFLQGANTGTDVPVSRAHRP